MSRQIKYLVWVGGVYNAFDTIQEAIYEQESLVDMGYDDVVIQSVTTGAKNYSKQSKHKVN